MYKVGNYTYYRYASYGNRVLVYNYSNLTVVNIIIQINVACQQVFHSLPGRTLHLGPNRTHIRTLGGRHHQQARAYGAAGKKLISHRKNYFLLPGENTRTVH